MMKQTLRLIHILADRGWAEGVQCWKDKRRCRERKEEIEIDRQRGIRGGRERDKGNKRDSLIEKYTVEVWKKI